MPKNCHDYQIGDPIYFYNETMQRYIQAEVLSIGNPQYAGNTLDVTLITVQKERDAFGIISADNFADTRKLYAYKTFKTLKELEEHLDNKNKEEYLAAYNDIKTVKDLLIIPLYTELCGEYCDLNTRKAYIDRAKELLGVDLKC